MALTQKHETDMLFVTGEQAAWTSLLPGCNFCKLEQTKMPRWIVSCSLLDCRQPQGTASRYVFFFLQYRLPNLVETKQKAFFMAVTWSFIISVGDFSGSTTDPNPTAWWWHVNLEIHTEPPNKDYIIEISLLS